jgi:DNA primase
MPKEKKPFVDFRAIRSRITMEQVLDHYDGLLDTFKRSGSRLSGPCPIHHGTNPSQFRVDTEKNLWNCFSECKQGGNVLDFIAKKEGISIHDAALKACEWFSIQIAEVKADNGSSQDESTPSPRPPTRSAPNEKQKAPAAPKESEAKSEPLAKAEDIGSNKPLGFTLQNLKTDHPYLSERGLTPETVAEFGLGYCAKGSMSGRIVIPIHNANAELVAYAGRWPGQPEGDSPKYKLPTGFKKSAELFNLHRAIREPADQPMILVEGFFDAIKLWQHGCRKVVALMGSILSPAQEQLIIQHSNDRSTVLLMFDEDDAGRFCREQTMLRLCERLYVRVFKFAEAGQQPDHLTPQQMQELAGGVL